MGHEVGHALFTPNDWSFEDRVPQQFVNVTEDARIEKLMKRKYPGLLKSFSAGYKELAEQDFFCIEDSDVDEMNLADRANLFFKIGKHLDIIFSTKENLIINQIADAETFDDAVEAAIQLYSYCKGDQQTNTQPIPMSPNSCGQGGGEKQEQSSDNQTPEESSGSTDENGQQQTEVGDNDTNNDEKVEDEVKEGTEPKVQTDSTFEQQVEDLCGNMNGSVTEYFELPEFHLNKIIVPFGEIKKKLDWAEDLYKNDEINVYAYPDAEYNKFKKSAAREVSYLVKECECKKSADA